MKGAQGLLYEDNAMAAEPETQQSLECFGMEPELAIRPLWYHLQISEVDGRAENVFTSVRISSIEKLNLS